MGITVSTIDFHVTSDCNQECPYCWGPQGFEEPVDTATARAIVETVAEMGIRRIVYTGGDPLLRPDTGELLDLSRTLGLEVALSTTGDELTSDFLAAHAASIDLVSLPIDGPSEKVSSLTKKEGHFTAVLAAMELLAAYPALDVKMATPVTRRNLDAVPEIVRLLEDRRRSMHNRFFYNVFQAFPRAMGEAEWGDLLVTAEEFESLKERVALLDPTFPINWLDHETLDRLYVMIFPDGTLTVPSGPDFLNYGPFLEVKDLGELLSRTDFDAPKHEKHSKGWTKDASAGG
jgi:MoaA/NifB/PqqE/SkfB family radical SAM enzyme